MTERTKTRTPTKQGDKGKRTTRAYQPAQKRTDRSGFDLGGATKEGRRGVHTTIPGGPRGRIPVGTSGSSSK